MTPPGALLVSLPFCGLPCPPARLTFERDRVTGAEGACSFCRQEATAPRATQARIAGKDASIDAALDRASELLSQSRRPFVYGLAASPVGTARLAARLAARIDAAVDVEGGDLLEPELGAIAATGQVTSTFGEMRASADLIVLWRIDPRATHPDLFPRGMKADPPAPAARRFVVVPPVSDHSGVSIAPEAHDLVVPIPRGRDLQALQRLRGLLHRAPTRTRDASLPVKELQAAAEAVASARRVAILWGGGIAADTPEGSAIAAGFALLTLDARPGGPRIAAKALGPAGNVAGAMAGLLAATGFPRAIGFAAGRARHDPDRFGAARLLDGGGADLVLAFEPLGPDRTFAGPTILIGSRHAGHGPEAEVFLPVAPAALLGDGVWLRADGVPLPRRPAALPSAVALPSEADILAALLDRLRAAA